ncbi:MAG TPA: hypothetical protein VIL01_06630 [Thermomicrobiales bacterium]
MNRIPTTSMIRERARWTSCGLIVGLVGGLFLGWMFHGLVGVVIRMAIVILVLLPFIAALIFWWSTRRNRTVSRSVEVDIETIQEATWRDAASSQRDERRY